MFLSDFSTLTDGTLALLHNFIFLVLISKKRKLFLLLLLDELIFRLCKSTSRLVTGIHIFRHSEATSAVELNASQTAVTEMYLIEFILLFFNNVSDLICHLHQIITGTEYVNKIKSEEPHAQSVCL